MIRPLVLAMARLGILGIGRLTVSAEIKPLSRGSSHSSCTAMHNSQGVSGIFMSNDEASWLWLSCCSCMENFKGSRSADLPTATGPADRQSGCALPFRRSVSNSTWRSESAESRHRGCSIIVDVVADAF